MSRVLPVAWCAMALTALGTTPMSAQEPARAITQTRFTVAANDKEWTPTGIRVVRDDIILVLAAGHVSLGATQPDLGPGGARGEGVLQVRIGDSVHAAQQVGERGFLIAERDGEVNLRILDDRYQDNVGAFIVSIIRIPATLIPRPGLAAGITSVPDSVAQPLFDMRHSLRQLVTAQEIYFADSARYARSMPALQYRPDPGVTVSLDFVGADAWRGSATHRAAPGWKCGIFIGDVPPYSPDQNEGEPKCWRTS